SWVKGLWRFSTPSAFWPRTMHPNSAACARTFSSVKWTSRPRSPRTMPSSPWKIWPRDEQPQSSSRRLTRSRTTIVAMAGPPRRNPSSRRRTLNRQTVDRTSHPWTRRRTCQATMTVVASLTVLPDTRSGPRTTIPSQQETRETDWRRSAS
ncbi:hypothetical protein BGZ82_005398, partial [Podila clonocystis]